MDCVTRSEVRWPSRVTKKNSTILYDMSKTVTLLGQSWQLTAIIFMVDTQRKSLFLRRNSYKIVLFFVTLDGHRTEGTHIHRHLRHVSLKLQIFPCSRYTHFNMGLMWKRNHSNWLSYYVWLVNQILNSIQFSIKKIYLLKLNIPFPCYASHVITLQSMIFKQKGCFRIWESGLIGILCHVYLVHKAEDDKLCCDICSEGLL